MKKLLTLIILALVVAACAHENFRQARVEVETGNEEEGLARLEQEVKEHPNDVELRNYYLRHKQAAAERYPPPGDNPRMPGAPDPPPQAYDRGPRIDPQNPPAKSPPNGLP